MPRLAVLREYLRRCFPQKSRIPESARVTEKLRGSIGVPWRVVSTRPVSIQALPARSWSALSSTRLTKDRPLVGCRSGLLPAACGSALSLVGVEGRGYLPAASAAARVAATLIAGLHAAASELGRLLIDRSCRVWYARRSCAATAGEPDCPGLKRGD